MRHTMLMAGISLALFTAAGAVAQMRTDPGAPPAASAMPVDAMGYAAMAAAGDQFEIQSSDLALSVSQNPKITKFAQEMIADHNQTSHALSTALTAAGMKPPLPALTPMQADMLAQLRSLSGAAFDRAYVRMQASAHDQALQLHQNYAANGDTPQLQGVARSAVAVVQEHRKHLAMLRV